MSVERKEYQETSIRRTVSPSRNFRSSNQNLSEFDSNLDYLLEDLQNSVSRPGSSLGYNTSSTYRESRNTNTLDSQRTNSLNRIANVKSSNPVTDYSSDDAYTYTTPDGRKVREYKKESYQIYKSSSGGGDLPNDKTRMQSSINQLDSLLDDLQQVKKSSTYDVKETSYSGGDPGLTTKKSTVNRELLYGDTPPKSKTLERTEESIREYSSEGTYGDLRPVRPTTPSSKTSTLSKQTKITNVHSYPMEIVETTHPGIDPEVLAHLDPNLRPPGNTKVTTTIKTYTYEIPGAGDYPTNLKKDVQVDEKYIYSPNKTITTPSRSFVYSRTDNEENTITKPEPTWEVRKDYVRDEIDRIERYPAPIAPSHTVLKETVTTRNYQPGYIPEQQPPSERTYIYNETTTTKNFNGHPNEPPRHDTYIIKDTRNTTTTNRTLPYADNPDYPVGNPPKETYIIRESNNTNRVINPPYSNGYPPSNKTVVYKHESHTTNNYGPGGPRRPNSPDYRPKIPNDVDTFDPKHPPPPAWSSPKEPVNIHYQYSSSSTQENKYKGGYPNGDGPNLVPRKFPTDNEIIDSGPPKRLDDLMATIGQEPPDSPLNAGFKQHEQELATQRKVDTLKRQQEEADEQKKEPIVKSKNVTGPPVYYPPGHEMFAKKEEGGAAWRAEGGYAKGSGMYEYEASSKSKSKSKSGATVVPVCLPLCCGLPCALL